MERKDLLINNPICNHCGLDINIKNEHCDICNEHRFTQSRDEEEEYK